MFRLISLQFCLQDLSLKSLKQEKFQHFEQADEKKFREVWEMNLAETIVKRSTFNHFNLDFFALHTLSASPCTLSFPMKSLVVFLRAFAGEPKICSDFVYQK